MMLELYLSPQYAILVSDQLLIFTIADHIEMSSFIHCIQNISESEEICKYLFRTLNNLSVLC